jgi:hypothetical protein
LNFDQVLVTSSLLLHEAAAQLKSPHPPHPSNIPKSTANSSEKRERIFLGNGGFSLGLSKFATGGIPFEGGFGGGFFGGGSALGHYHHGHHGFGYSGAGHGLGYYGYSKTEIHY